MRSPQRRIPQFFTPSEEKIMRHFEWGVSHTAEVATRRVLMHDGHHKFTIYPNGEWNVVNEKTSLLQSGGGGKLHEALQQIQKWVSLHEERKS